jgi:hypothetical protein
LVNLDSPFTCCLPCCRRSQGPDGDAMQVIAICGAFFEFFMAVMGSYGKHMKQVYFTIWRVACGV